MFFIARIQIFSSIISDSLFGSQEWFMYLAGLYGTFPSRSYFLFSSNMYTAPLFLFFLDSFSISSDLFSDSFFVIFSPLYSIISVFFGMSFFAKIPVLCIFDFFTSAYSSSSFVFSLFIFFCRFCFSLKTFLLVFF